MFPLTTQPALEYLKADRAIRQPLVLPRRIGFISAEARSGCSRTAGLIAACLAHRRQGRILAVNAAASPEPAQGRRSMIWHAGLQSGTVSDSDLRRVRRNATAAEEACAGLVQTPNGLYCHDLTALSDFSPQSWWTNVAPTSRFFDLVLTDWGHRVETAVESLIDSSHIICVATRLDMAALRRAQRLVHQIQTSTSAPVKLVISDLDGNASTGLRMAMGSIEVPRHLFGYEPERRRARLLRGKLPLATRTAVAHLAADTVSTLAQAEKQAVQGPSAQSSGPENTTTERTRTGAEA
ncbi:hypothetical protein HGQ17_08250 [Nesterenkonia sp. MY13]|uniref:CpsD/CapB family tyrosine-protein kinase n=1 Tax=Nesterenkonia sedimenti TaxID=1463632 RepID=A0A7X8TL36_9MICC|nr:hypothetical protein [Nesterenkonia sedimenti]NLS09988.1 hypothetical protein [Nesterenkonia sedimenti]